MGLGAFLLALVGLPAVVRFSYSWSMPWATLAGGVIALAVAGAWRLGTAEERETATMRGRVVFGILVVLIVAALVHALRHPLYDGLPIRGSSDAAAHVYFKHDFVAGDARTYHGFTLSYGAAWILEQLSGRDEYYSFHALFYLALGVMAFVGLRLGWLTLRVVPRREWKVAIAVAGAVLLLGHALLVVPVLYVHFADGFWGHCIALAPIFLCWLVAALVGAPLLRFLLLGVGVVAVRHTYGLNLGDLFLALAAVAALDARGERGRVRLVWGVASAGFATLAVGAWHTLWPRLGMSGIILPIAFAKILAVFGAFVVLQLIGTYMVRLRLTPALRRAFVFALVFSLAGVAVPAVYWALHPGADPQYYILKYPLHAQIVLVWAAGLLALLVPFTWRASLVAGVFAGAVPYGAWRDLYLVARAPHPDPTIMIPLQDRLAQRLVRETLAEEKKAFAGIVLPWYAQYGFANSQFGPSAFPQTKIVQFQSAHTDLRPGTCAFLVTSQSYAGFYAARAGDYGDVFREGVAQITQREGVRCKTYKISWPPFEERQLCYRCE